MQRKSRNDSNGKVVVVRSPNYYSTLSPIKILQLNQTLETIRESPSLCNKIDKERINTYLVPCDTCQNNKPSTSSHACGNFPEGSEKPLSKQVTSLRKFKLPKPQSKKRRENFSIAGQPVAGKTDSGKNQKRNYVRRSKGPKSTSSLVKDATPKRVSVEVIDDLTALWKGSGSISPVQEGDGNFTEPNESELVLWNSSYVGTKSPNNVLRNVTIGNSTPPKRSFHFIDLTTLPEPIVISSGGSSETTAEDIGAKFHDDLDESILLDLLDLEIDLQAKREQTTNLYPAESSPIRSSPTYKLPIYEPVGKYETPRVKSQGPIRQEELADQLLTIEDAKIILSEEYNEYIGNREESPDRTCNLFSRHELRKLPDNIFETPVKLKNEEGTFSNIQREFFKNISKIVTLDEIHSSVEIKREIINYSSLVDDDICENTGEPIASYRAASPIKLWEISPENLSLDVELAETPNERKNTRSPLSELLDIVFNTAPNCEESVKENKIVINPDPLKNTIDSLAMELSTPLGDIPKEIEHAIFTETITSDSDTVSANTDVTEDINERVETLICPKTQTASLDSIADKCASFANFSNPEVENVQIANITFSESPIYTDTFTNANEDLYISEEIEICSEIQEESTKTEEDIVATDMEENTMETIEPGSMDVDTCAEAPNRLVPEKSPNAEIIHYDHCYGYVSPPASSELTLADKVPTETMSAADIAIIEKDGVVLMELDVMQPINDETDKKEEEKDPQQSKDVAKELEAENLTSVNQEKTNVDKQAASQDYSGYESTSTVLNDTQIYNLKNKIMDGTINKQEILEIIEGKNIQYTVVDPNQEQQKRELQHLGDSLKKRLGVMNATNVYLDDIIKASLKGLNTNVTEAKLKIISNNLNFVKRVIDRTFVYCDTKKNSKKDVRYKVINITQKKGPQTRILNRGPLGTSRNGTGKIRKRSKMLTMIMYRMKQLLDAMEHRSVLRTRRQNAFISKLRQIAKNDLDKETRKMSPDAASTKDPSGRSQKTNLRSTPTCQRHIKRAKRRKILTSIENVSSPDCNENIKEFATKITPMRRDIRIILSDIDNIKERVYSGRNTRQDISRDILEKKSRKVSKVRESQDIFAFKSNEENDMESGPASSIMMDRIGKQSQKVGACNQERKLSSETRSRRTSRKPPGFYSESKLKDSSRNGTSVLKYDVNCLDLIDSEPNIIEYIDLTDELNDDDKPCVISYNKKEDVKMPIFNNSRSECEKYKRDEPLATAPPSKVRRNLEPNVPEEIKKAKNQPTQHEEPGRVQRNKKKSKPVNIVPRRSLRSMARNERNAVKESLKTS